MGARTSAAVQRRSFPSLTVVLAAAVAGVDLLSKWVVTERLGPGTGTGSWWLPGGWLGFDYGRNTGAAFSIFAGNPELLAALSVVIAAGICWLIWVEVSSFRLRVLCSGLILGGAGGNFIERVRQGFVTDFVAVGPWPRFNVADSAVCVGVVLMVLAVVFQSGRSTSRDVAAGVADSRRPFLRNTVDK